MRILAPAEYYESIYIIPPIAIGIFFYSITNLYSNILVYYQKTKYVMYPAAVAAIVNVGLNAVFIPKYGYMAAAYTTLFAYAMQPLLQVGFAKSISKKHANTSDVYNDKIVLVLSIVITVTCLSALSVYGVSALRYTVIGVLCTGVMIFRKFIYQRIVEMRRK